MTDIQMLSVALILLGLTMIFMKASEVLTHRSTDARLRKVEHELKIRGWL